MSIFRTHSHPPTSRVEVPSNPEQGGSCKTELQLPALIGFASCSSGPAEFSLFTDKETGVQSPFIPSASFEATEGKRVRL